MQVSTVPAATVAGHSFLCSVNIFKVEISYEYENEEKKHEGAPLTPPLNITVTEA